MTLLTEAGIRNRMNIAFTNALDKLRLKLAMSAISRVTKQEEEEYLKRMKLDTHHQDPALNPNGHVTDGQS